MAMFHPCIPCQYGQHERHDPVPGPVPEGYFGGWICPCEGECVETYEPLEFIPYKPDPEEEARMVEAMEFLDRVSKAQREDEIRRLQDKL